MSDQNNDNLKQIMFHMPLFRQVFFVDPRDIFQEYPDLKPSHIHAMLFLMVSGGTTMSRLASLLRLEKGSMTTVAERIVSAGLAERQTDPADRRKSVLRLTQKGRSLAEAHHNAHAGRFAQRLERLSDAEQAEFIACLLKMNDLMRHMLDPGQLACLHPHAPDAGTKPEADPRHQAASEPSAAPEPDSER